MLIWLMLENVSPSVVEWWLKLFDRYGVSLVALVVLGFLTWFFIKFIIKKLNNQENKIDDLVTKLLDSKKPDEHHQPNIEKFAKNASKVQQLCYYLLNEFEADRVSVFEYHNGGKTMCGVDFKKCSNTYEATELGIESKYKEYQNIPISINFLWNKLLLDKKPILIMNVDELKEHDTTIYTTLKSDSVKSYYSKLLLDYDNKPIGFINIVFYKNAVSLNEEQLKMFFDSTITIAGLINKE